jgi:DNA repair photolyase
VGLKATPPGISDRPEQLAEVVRAAREAGATSVWANVLFLRPGTREHFLESLARDWPEQLERYERLYADRAYLGKAETDPVRKRVRELAASHDVRDRRRVRLEPEPPVIAEQLALAV